MSVFLFVFVNHYASELHLSACGCVLLFIVCVAVGVSVPRFAFMFIPASSQSQRFVEMPEKENVFLFVPNLIGYARTLLAVIGFYVAFEYPWVFGITYSLSFILDGADGYYARKLDQCTDLGAVLDMVVDRCGTAGLCIILSHFYPSLRFWFICLIMLDFTSHWYKMYSSLKLGQGHKTVSKEKTNPLLYLYYTSRPVLGFVCTGNEFFYIGLYMYHFDPSTVVMVFTLICFPVWAFKQVTNVIQLTGSMKELADIDAEMRLKRAK